MNLTRRIVGPLIIRDLSNNQILVNQILIIYFVDACQVLRMNRSENITGITIQLIWLNRSSTV